MTASDNSDKQNSKNAERELPDNQPVYRNPHELQARRQTRSRTIEILGLVIAIGSIAYFVNNMNEPGESENAGSPPTIGTSTSPTLEDDVALNLLPIGPAGNSPTTSPANAQVGPQDNSATPIESTSVSAKAHAVLKKHCMQCHGIKQVIEGLNVNRHATLLNPEHGYVIPSNLEESVLWQRVGVEGDMPPDGAAPIPEGDVAILKRWIIEGAMPFPVREQRRFISEIEVWSAIQQDLTSLPSQRRRYLRYFSFTNLHNNSFSKRLGRNGSDSEASDIAMAKAALAKLVNSLSWMSSLVLPEQVDSDGVVFRIDLAELGWYDRHLWGDIQKVYPYGLRLDVHPDQRFRSIAEAVYRDTGTKLPLIRADWFIDTAARPPLYTRFLNLPATVHELEERLGVDVEEDFLNGRLRRAGFSASGVSQSNRLIDRHPSKSGAYWKSFDFGSSEGRANLFRFPLGPRFSRNPHNDFAFQADGGEMIFSLPNGLQGYYLADATGKQLDAGPTEIVRDTKETSGSPAVVNGLSCMACHQRGVIRFRDTVRIGRTVPLGKVRLKVEELFVPEEETKQLLDQDEERFMNSLIQLVAPHLSPSDPSAFDPARQMEEPIGLTARLYQRDIEIEEACVELGYNSPARLAALIRNNRTLREKGLGSLAEGAAIKRSTWASLNDSIFHLLALELELGTPLNTH